MTDLPAGRRLDAWIAEQVMGWKQVVVRQENPGVPDLPFQYGPHTQGQRPSEDHPYSVVPHYSTDIAAAWEIVEKLRHDRFPFVSVGIDWYGKTWEARFGVNQHGNSLGYAQGCETAPLAICRAALTVDNYMKNNETPSNREGGSV